MDGPGYDGMLSLRFGEVMVPARGRLRGRFDPIDGRYHWYGRVEASDALTLRARGAAVTVHVATPVGEAAGVIGDADMWGRLRVAGTGRPPFALPEIMEEEQ